MNSLQPAAPARVRVNLPTPLGFSVSGVSMMPAAMREELQHAAAMPDRTTADEIELADMASEDVEGRLVADTNSMRAFCMLVDLAMWLQRSPSDATQVQNVETLLMVSTCVLDDVSIRANELHCRSCVMSHAQCLWTHVEYRWRLCHWGRSELRREAPEREIMAHMLPMLQRCYKLAETKLSADHLAIYLALAKRNKDASALLGGCRHATTRIWAA